MDDKVARLQTRLDTFVDAARAIDPNPECAPDSPAFDAWVNVGFAAWDLARATGWPPAAIWAAAGLPDVDLGI
jgi:hypothetical protein